MPTQMYQDDYEDLARKQALATMLRQQSMQPIETQSVGGIPAPISPLQGLSKMFEGYQSGQMEKGLATERKQASQKYNEDLAAALRGYAASGDTTALVSSGHPMAQQIGIARMANEQTSKAASQKMQEEYGLKKQFEIDPEVIAAKQRSHPQKSDYFQPIQTAEGVYGYDTRRNVAIPLNIGGKQIVGSASDPTLQGKISYEKSVGSETGKGLGEAKTSLSAAQSSYPQLENTVNTLKELGKTATYTYAGQAQDLVTRQLGGTTPGAIAREKYTQTVRDVLFPQLRATFGAQFTVKEGEALIATLGDPNKSPPEKNAALDAFIDQKKQHIESLQRQTGQTGNQSTPPAKAGGVKFLGFE